jgi:hypothetical protein
MKMDLGARYTITTANPQKKQKAEPTDSAPDRLLNLHDGLWGLLLEPPDIHEDNAISHRHA